ncbi:TIGR03619 family F420-dependent LLM class oxidoreductase [Actinocrispum wychmicini]|uniref:Putative F420-dependent oxidoreductase n=1 Tax=Actinocrispum wychmicini TaxID=1213861 RepID=A0A4R2J1H4_9PSEU|nr:TIGR03619 family F420-dependent LLM class oxidoreductase [Actinocrispum wychmicini]TCO50686.1 putative F420-dependent oxidoreductase [Actinocrispum wychmicini]
MELGVGLPTAGAIASPDAIVRVAQEAERLGYAAVWTFERLLRPVGKVAMIGVEEPQELPEIYRSVYEPLVTLSVVAASTSRVKLGTSVIDVLMHPPVVLARRFATLDQFSGGRVIAGLGQGWMREEFETVGVPTSRKGAGFEESIAALRAAWGPDPVSFDGRFYKIAPSEINPKPVQSRVPVLVGAVTPKGIERAARIADGLNPIAFARDQLVGATTAFLNAAKEAGRDPAELTVVARANVPITDKPIDTDRPFLAGSPEQIADDLATLDGTGVDQVLFANDASVDLDTEVDLLRRLAEATGTAA